MEVRNSPWGSSDRSNVPQTHVERHNEARRMLRQLQKQVQRIGEESSKTEKEHDFASSPVMGETEAETEAGESAALIDSSGKVETDVETGHLRFKSIQDVGNTSRFSRDVQVYDRREQPPLYQGGCCRGGHMLTIAVVLLALLFVISLTGAFTILLTDTLHDTKSDAFITGICFICFSVPLSGFMLYYYHLESARRLATVIYTFDESEMDPDSTLQKPMPSAKASETADMVYSAVSGEAHVVSVLVPIMYSATLLLVDLAILSLRAFNERHGTLVIAIFLYIAGFVMLCILLAYAWRRERSLALVLTLRTDLMDFLNPKDVAQPGVYSFIGDHELPTSNDYLRIQELKHALRNEATSAVGDGFELWGQTVEESNDMGQRLYDHRMAKLSRPEYRRVKQKKTHTRRRVSKTKRTGVDDK
jgi:hypothetical protein